MADLVISGLSTMESEVSQRGAKSMPGICRVFCRTVRRTIVVSGIPGWSTRVEYQGVHGGVSDGNKVTGHVGMCEDTTSERELRKTGMSSLSHASPCPHNRFATTCRAQPAGLVTVSTLARCNFARRPWRSLDMVALMAFIILPFAPLSHHEMECRILE